MVPSFVLEYLLKYLLQTTVTKCETNQVDRKEKLMKLLCEGRDSDVERMSRFPQNTMPNVGSQ